MAILSLDSLEVPSTEAIELIKNTTANMSVYAFKINVIHELIRESILCLDFYFILDFMPKNSWVFYIGSSNLSLFYLGLVFHIPKATEPDFKNKDCYDTIPSI